MSTLLIIAVVIAAIVLLLLSFILGCAISGIGYEDAYHDGWTEHAMWFWQGYYEDNIDNLMKKKWKDCKELFGNTE